MRSICFDFDYNFIVTTKKTDVGNSLEEYFLYKILRKYIMHFIVVAQMNHQKYVLIFCLYCLYPIFCDSVYFLVSWYKTVCGCHFKTIFFSSWGRAFLFFSLLPKEMWGGNLHTGEIENNIEEPICQLTKKKALITL